MVLTNRKGIFSLTDILQRQNTGDWSTGSWLDGSGTYKSLTNHYGYFNGFYDGNPSKILNKIDYSNDTVKASSLGLLSPSSFHNASVGNISYGYVAGGYDGTTYFNSVVDRIDYSNDAAAALVRGPLSKSGARMGATGNLNYGYFGGFYTPSTVHSTIDRLDYSNDLAGGVEKSVLTGSPPRLNCAAVGNESYGYWAGGSDGTNRHSTIDRLDYSNDTSPASQKCSLGTATISDQAATGNANFGYFGGGESPTGAAATIYRLDYSNDTTNATPKGALSAPRFSLSATGNQNYGYWAGGKEPSSVSKVERTDYSNDTATIAPKGPLTAVSYSNSACSSSENALPKQYDSVPHISDVFNTQPIGTDYGYFVAGDVDDDSTTSIDRLDFTNDTANAVTKGSLNTTLEAGTTTGNQNYGYWAGGWNSFLPSWNRVSIVERIDYSNDTAIASRRGNLPSSKSGMGGGGNQNYGYIVGGWITGPMSEVDRIDYSSDTVNPLSLGNLFSKAWGLAAVCNQSYGWFAGGESVNIPSTRESRIYRIDYSNDTVALPFKGYLTYKSRMLAATGNTNYGYFAGGDFPTFSNVDRLDYSNDTNGGVSKGDLLPGPVEQLTATGNANYGYFAGGQDQPGANIYSTIRRLDYSNDTSPMVDKGTLQSGEKTQLRSVSSRANALPTARIAHRESLEGVLRSVGNDFGYWNLQDGSSQIDRMDYSNDTAITSSRSSMGSGNRRSSDGVSSHNYGYWGGGDIHPAPTPKYFITIIERLDYANDTADAVPKGKLTFGRIATAAAGNENYGYWATGVSAPGPNEASTVDRIDYSNDGVDTLSRGTVSTYGVSAMAGVGNPNYGYWGGGDNPGSWNPDRTKKVWRLNYSNDTVAASDRGDVNNFYVSHQKATGNANYGYFAGGWDGSNYHSEIQRLDYSNDTEDLVLRGTLATDMGVGSATGDQNYGYFGGGYAPARSPAETSEVQRLDYANDTTNATPKGPLSNNNQSWAATSSRENALPTTKPVIEAFTFEKIAGSSFPYGYWGGGSKSPFPPGTRITNTQRIDYSNDTSSLMLRGNLILALNNLAAIGTQDYGYFGGGSDGSPRADVQRLDYSNDYSIMSPRASLSGSREQHAAAGNKDYGYFGGGFVGGTPSATSTIDRLDYANDTVRAPALGPLLTARYQLAATSTNDFGYWAGGNKSPGWCSTMERTDFSNDIATAVTKGPLSGPRAYITSCGTGTKDYGYIMGGSGLSDYSSVDRIDYSNDTAITSVRGPLTSARYYHSVTGSQSFGYVAGGSLSLPIAPVVAVSNIDRIDYSNDTAVGGVRNYLVAGSDGKIREMGGVSAQQHQFASLYNLSAGASTNSVYGYFGGGNPGGAYISTVDRFDFTNDTANTVTKGPLSLARVIGSSATGNSNAGYFAGGHDQTTIVDTVDRIDYSNDTAIASIRGPLANARSNISAVGNQNYGYFASGNVGSTDYSDVQRIDYSNDTATATTITASQPGNATHGHASAGNQSYGFIGGGYQNAYSTTRGMVNKIDYSNETVSLVGNDALIVEREDLAVAGNKDYGYWGGGMNFTPTPTVIYSTIERLDYSSTFAIAVVKGPLNVARSSLAATGNRDYGYWGGGSPLASSIERIDYSNDTVTATLKGDLSGEKSSLGAVSAQENALPVVGLTLAEINFETRPGSANYGYFGGGIISPPSPAAISNIDRFDYSNDTVKAISRSTLSAAKGLHGAVGNRSYGYFAGGIAPGSPDVFYSAIDRIDYSNDDVSVLKRSKLISDSFLLAATGNKDYGYWIGGNGPRSTILRTDYSNDTVDPAEKATILSAPNGTGSGTALSAATGNHNYGYYGGGTNKATQSYYIDYIYRIDYSNDISSPTPKGSLSGVRTATAATGNKDYGYWAGGEFPSASPGTTVSVINRLDYSNDTVESTPKGKISIKRSRMGATGNKDYGYFGGGRNSLPNPDVYYNIIDRIDYSNDLVGAPQRSMLTYTKQGANACSGGANGLPQ